MNDFNFTHDELNKMYDEAVQWEPPFHNTEFPTIQHANLQANTQKIVQAGQSESIT
jgi:hypothetical protein